MTAKRGTRQSARQLLTKLIHEPQGILGGLMRDVEINHGGGDLLMAEQLLDGVQMRAGFEEMRGKGMTQRMDRSGGKVELFAGQDHEPLQRGTRDG